MSTKAYQVSGFDMVKTQSSCLILDDASSQTSGATTPSVVDDTSPVLYDFGNVDASLNQQKLNILVDQRDSAHTGVIIKIVKASFSSLIHHITVFSWQ